MWICISFTPLPAAFVFVFIWPTGLDERYTRGGIQSAKRDSVIATLLASGQTLPQCLL
jgi:hypothetical protein